MLTACEHVTTGTRLIGYVSKFGAAQINLSESNKRRIYSNLFGLAGIDCCGYDIHGGGGGGGDMQLGRRDLWRLELKGNLLGETLVF